MEAMGVGLETKVERRIPMGDGVMVTLMESSMSAEYVSGMNDGM